MPRIKQLHFQIVPYFNFNGRKSLTSSCPVANRIAPLNSYGTLRLFPHFYKIRRETQGAVERIKGIKINVPPFKAGMPLVAVQ